MVSKSVARKTIILRIESNSIESTLYKQERYKNFIAQSRNGRYNRLNAGRPGGFTGRIRIQNMSPFDYLAMPGSFDALQAHYRRRIGRHAPQLPRAHRESWIDDRVAFAVELFLDGPPFNATDVARAINRPVAYLRRANWHCGKAGSKRRTRQWHPYVASMTAAGDNPSAIVALCEGDPDALLAVQGRAGRVVPGGVVQVRGGTASGRETDGKIVPTVKVNRAWIENGEERFEIECGWRMTSPRTGHVIRYDAGEVREEIEMVDRFAGHQPPPPAADRTRDVCVVVTPKGVRGQTIRCRISTAAQ
jgi:hypothetical protein